MSGPRELAPAMDAAWDLLERRDLEGFMAIARRHLAADVEFKSGIGSVVGGGVYRGHAGIEQWFGEILETASAIRWRDRTYEALGETVLLFLAHLELTGVASQATVSSEVGAVYEFEEGLCRRIISFTSHADARAAAEAVNA